MCWGKTSPTCGLVPTCSQQDYVFYLYQLYSNCCRECIVAIQLQLPGLTWAVWSVGFPVSSHLHACIWICVIKCLCVYMVLCDWLVFHPWCSFALSLVFLGKAWILLGKDIGLFISVYNLMKKKHYLFGSPPSVHSLPKLHHNYIHAQLLPLFMFWNNIIGIILSLHRHYTTLLYIVSILKGDYSITQLIDAFTL